MKYTALLFVFILLLSSCSEDPVSVDTKPYLEISPDSLTGTTYTSYTFKARLHNFPFGEVRYTWYFGEGDTTLRKIDNEASWQYNKPGNYTLSVIAYDSFADTILATKLVPITIISAEPQVSLSPSTHDTAVTQLIDGTFEYFSFKVNSNLPSYNAVFHWHFSGGPSDTVVYNYEFIGYKFPSTGIHHVSVDVYDKNGTYWGSDSTTINISKALPTSQILADAKQISVVLYSQSVLKDSLDYFEYIAAGVKRGTNTTTNYSVNGGQIECSTTFTETYVDYNRLHDIKISGVLNNDFTKISELHFDVWDSAFVITNSSILINHVIVDLTNIQLLTMTNDYVIYLAHQVPTSSYVENVKINRNNSGNYGLLYAPGQID